MGWSELPVDLLLLVEENIERYSDKLRIRAVCLYWHLQLPKMPDRQSPWLLQSVCSNVHLFNPINKKCIVLDCGELLRGKIFKGSGYGWVVTLEGVYDMNNSSRIFLMNPVSSFWFELPSRNNFPDVMSYHPTYVNAEYSVFLSNEGNYEDAGLYSFQRTTDELTHKFVLSCDPFGSGGNEWVVACIYGPNFRLACCTVNDKKWNPLPIKVDMFMDVIFYRGLLLGLIYQYGTKYQVLAFENITGVKQYPRITLIADHHGYNLLDTSTLNSNYNEFNKRDYLVESSDGCCLMIVERISGKRSGGFLGTDVTCNFKVYRVDSVKRRSVELKSIGDDILILGLNTSMSISSHNSVGYKRNHIYFTDMDVNFYRSYSILKKNDIGVFSLEDGTFQPLSGPKFLWPPPIWINLS